MGAEEFNGKEARIQAGQEVEEEGWEKACSRGRAPRQGNETACRAALVAHLRLHQEPRFRKDTFVLSIIRRDKLCPL